MDEHASVAEIEPQEVRVVTLRKLERLATADRAGPPLEALGPALEVRRATASPVADGASRDAGSPGYLTVVQARPDKL
jgi:hypothetical protein